MADVRGATVSKKTIALAAIEERRVTFTLGPGWEFEGYFCGMDDYHYKVVSVGGAHGSAVRLIHKAGTVVTIFQNGPTMSDESDTAQSALRPIIAPFKEAMERDRRSSPQDAQGADA